MSGFNFLVVNFESQIVNLHLKPNEKKKPIIKFLGIPFSQRALQSVPPLYTLVPSLFHAVHNTGPSCSVVPLNAQLNASGAASYLFFCPFVLPHIRKKLK
jgi:hypothetical protein